MIGKRIRDKRQQAGLSLKELAEKTGLTPGFLSQIERDISEPSITSLRKIADVLGVAVFYFLIEDVGSNPVVRKSERKILNLPENKLTYELLCPDVERQMEMYIGKLKPGAFTSKENHSHTGEEAVHVLEGKMHIVLGDEEYILEAGDTIYYFSNIPHCLYNREEQDLVFVAAMTPLSMNI